jgi:hypothetical protein
MRKGCEGFWPASSLVSFREVVAACQPRANGGFNNLLLRARPPAVKLLFKTGTAKSICGVGAESRGDGNQQTAVMRRVVRGLDLASGWL